MKKLLFPLVLIVSAFIINGNAQSNKLSLIGRPRLLPNEFIGIKDINGNYCAGIAVVSDKDGFIYDSNMGVVKVDDKPGRDIVYLSPEEQVLDVYLAGFAPLQLILHDIGISLHPKEMWEIHVGAEEYFKLDSLPVAITSIPQYDEIMIDGKKHGPGPIQKLVQGTHILQIKMPNYQTLRDTIKVDKDHLQFDYKLKELEYARLRITSIPAGASVYIDDVYVNQTPLETMYPTGNHLLRIEKSGYQKIEQIIQIKKPLTAKNFVLEKLKAYLKINTYNYAQITIDGQKVSANTKLTLEPKVVTLKIYVAGMDSIRRTIPLYPNKLQKIDFYPNFPAGEVQISADPLKALISLYDFNNKLVAQDTAQLILRKLPATSYLLKVSAPGYKEDQETIVVVPNQTITRIVHLKPQQTMASSKPSSKKQSSDHRPWRSIVLLNTTPREPGTDIFRWTWNPAAIQHGFLISGGAVYENYRLKHETSRNTVYRQMQVKNQIYYSGAYLSAGIFQLGINYAKRIKYTEEANIRIVNQSVIPHSYREVSETVSPTLGIRFPFGLSIAARGNFQKIRFSDRGSGIENNNSTSIFTIDAGVEQNLGNVLFVDLFANSIKEFVNGDEIHFAYFPKYVNASATLKLGTMWLTGGVRLTRAESFTDSLLFLRANLQVSNTVWLKAFYTQSRVYPIVDMDVNMSTPVVIMGGGFHLNLDGLILGYQATFLKFSRVANTTYGLEANLLDRNHWRHEISVALALQ